MIHHSGDFHSWCCLVFITSEFANLLYWSGRLLGSPATLCRRVTKRHCLQKPLQSYNIFVECSLFLSFYSIYFILFDFILLYFVFNNIFLKLIAGVSQQRLSSKLLIPLQNFFTLINKHTKFLSSALHSRCILQSSSWSDSYAADNVLCGCTICSVGIVFACYLYICICGLSFIFSPADIRSRTRRGI